uniref:GFP-like yellow fluorescent protein n=1 Tax=Corynactis californica TaxID=44298 RepID=Q2VTM8_CORYC|nr:GFP-like yellow fluorescent protein [Corynactis californica]
MSHSKQVITQEMKMVYHMDGCVNGHSFTIEGEGTGKPYEGNQTLKLRVTKGGPLPFAFDILTATFCYGNRCFCEYPEDMPDYYKQSFPEGYSFERTMMFEDGACCTTSVHLSLTKNCFVHNSTFHGVNFPANGPVMQKKTLNWEPSSEKITPFEGNLKGDVTMFLKLEGGQQHRCQFQTTYKAHKAVKMPPNHIIEHRLVRSQDGDAVQLKEHAVAKCFTA